MRINWRFGVEETIFRHQIGQIQIRLVKSANRSDVFPVSLEDKRAHVSILDRLWNDVLPEIDQIIFQTFDQHLSIKDVNSHRSLK